jgi:hypothetical protein
MKHGQSAAIVSLGFINSSWNKFFPTISFTADNIAVALLLPSPKQASWGLFSVER